MQRLGAALICLVFALPFGGVGAGASWVVYRMIQDSHRAQDWVGVRATVDSFGRGKVNYHYTYRDVDYRGDRLGANPVGGTDDIDSWHDDMFAMLSAAKGAKQPITVWVNPDDPAESMVDRDVRWKLVFFAIPFALGFGGVGVGALFMFFRVLVFGAERAEPTSARTGRGVLPAWIMAFFWNVISVPASVFIIEAAMKEGEWIWLALLIFPLIGVLLLWGAITTTMKAVGDRFRREPELPTLLVPKKPANDGVFARGLIDDARPAAAGAAAAAIDTGDDGLPAPPDPAVAQLERLSGKTLSAEQREQLGKMSPQSKAMLGKFAGWLGKVKEVQDK